MLSIIGSSLNWLAAGLLFPLILMPLGIFFSRTLNLTGKYAQTLIWLAVIISVIALGILFIHLTPGQSLPALTRPLIKMTGALFIVTVVINIMGGPEQNLLRLSALSKSIAIFAGRSVMWLLLVMALTQFTIVVLRYVFGISFIWMQESITYMHGAVFLLAAGYALITQDHVRVDIFYRDASEHHKARVNLVGIYLLLLPVCLLLLWAASPYIFASWLATEGSNESSGVQLLYLLKSLIPAFAILLMIAAFHEAVKAVETLTNPSRADASFGQVSHREGSV